MDIQAIWLNFHDAVTNHYFDMRGRVGRAQFWYFILVDIILSLLAGIMQAVTWLPVSALFSLAMLPPLAGMGARRLQDSGRDGRLVWVLFFLIAATQVAGILTAVAVAMSGFLGLVFAPGLGIASAATMIVSLVLIWFWVQRGTPGDNQYGPPPPVFDPSRPVWPAS